MSLSYRTNVLYVNGGFHKKTLYTADRLIEIIHIDSTENISYSYFPRLRFVLSNSSGIGTYGIAAISLYAHNGRYPVVILPLFSERNRYIPSIFAYTIRSFHKMVCKRENKSSLIAAIDFPRRKFLSRTVSN